MNATTLLMALLFSFVAVGQNTKKDLTLEDIWASGILYPKTVSGYYSMNDGRYYTSMAYNPATSEQSIVKYEYTTGNAVDTLLKESSLVMGDKAIALNGYTFSSDEQQLLISDETESIYRHSTRSLYYVWNLSTKTITPITKEKIRLCTFSPDGSKVAYVQKNNLYTFDIATQKATQVTSDGVYNQTINGATDWVYEEEFAFTKAFFWSPKGDKIAFYQFDEDRVKQFSMAMYGDLYPEEYRFKYPKAGEDNSLVTIHTYHLSTDKTVRMDIGEETNQYIPRIKWTQDNNLLCIQRMNRLQNKLELLLANSTDGSSKVILTEENKAYIDITDNLTFLKNGKQFIFTSEQDGYNHIYLYDMNGKLVSQVTSGSWDVDALVGIDEKKKLVYYTSSEVSPMERHLYVVKTSGKGKKQLTKRKGWNSVQFNSNHTYYLNTNSQMGVPHYITVHKSDGKQVRLIEDNTDLQERLSKYNMGTTEFFNFKIEDGTALNGWMIKPADFNPKKEYPLLMFVYGGPGSQTVKDSWGYNNYFWYQYMASKGYIIASVDNRGTGARGEAFKKVTYLQLGKYETEDQIAAAKYLGSQSYIDASRIGIFGWSYGGYMSSLCISKGAEQFKLAVAVAPVTNWRYYDNIYTERYMRTPQENGDNYDSNSPINHIEKIKGDYLIVHGTADDNVHFQNTAEMVNALIRKNIPFDSEFYPNKNHGIYGGYTRLHLFNKISRFVTKNL